MKKSSYSSLALEKLSFEPRRRHGGAGVLLDLDHASCRRRHSPPRCLCQEQAPPPAAAGAAVAEAGQDGAGGVRGAGQLGGTAVANFTKTHQISLRDGSQMSERTETAEKMWMKF